MPHEDKRPPASWNFIARGWDAFTGVFNRGFDRLAHGYAGAADFVIRHSVVMLLLYVALIGSAGWLLVTTPQGFIPGAGPRLRHRLGAIAGRGVAGAHHRDRARDRANCAGYAGHHSRGGVRRLLGRDANAGEQCRGAVPGVRGPGRAPQEGTVRGWRSRTICASGWPRSRAPSSSSFRRRAVPGIGTGGGFTMRIQDRQGRGPEMLAAANRRTGRRGAQGAGPDPGVLAVHRQHAAAVRRYRSRQGAEARRADRQHQRNDPDLFRLVLRQRLQPVRPHLSRHGAGRPAVPERDRPIWRGCAPATPPATW